MDCLTPRIELMDRLAVAVMEETTLFYETRDHASRPYTSNYPPQSTESSTRSFLSIISPKGLSQFREKWVHQKQPKKLRKMVSLFASSTGEYIAVAAANQITILRRSDDYMSPCGIFTNRSFCTFTAGAWSEHHNVLGVVDDNDTLYFIKANGDEISRIARSSLQVPLPIVGLIMPDDSDSQRFPLPGFTVATSDGSFQHIEIGDVRASISSVSTSTVKRHFQSIVCLEYHPQLSVLAVVGVPTKGTPASIETSGHYSLAIWRGKSNAEVDHLFDIQFDASYTRPESYQGQLSYPKVSISQRGTFVATLDLNGDLHIFRPEYEKLAISSVCFRERLSSEDLLSDIVDFTWWSDHIIAFAKQNGKLIMVNVLSGVKVKEDNNAHYLPVLVSFPELEGQVFLVDTIYKERTSSSRAGGKEGLPVIGQNTRYSFDGFDISSLYWKLTAFSERSLQEMYRILISNKEYQAALKFADSHGLDRDEVYKSQWLHSEQISKEIINILSIIKDQAFVLSECIEKVGPTEDTAKALLEHGLLLTSQYAFSELDDESDAIWDIRMSRLKLLQFRDRLETYMGINMGRFSVQEYKNFRNIPINKAASELAESGKIGALNLLFKRHPYSLATSMLEVLAAIPETVNVQTYMQLLPGSNAPPSIAVREEDWVECKKMVDFLDMLPGDNETAAVLKTEPIIKQSSGYYWPSTDELSKWYTKRALDIDCFSGQLDNCLCLVEIGLRKGINGLQMLHEDITYFIQLIFADDSDVPANASLSLVTWEQLPDYEKFRKMLEVVDGETVVKSLCNKAVPFMRKRSGQTSYSEDNEGPSFLVRWLKEIAAVNKLEICLMVFDEGCKDFGSNCFFRDEVEIVDCALQCVYLCTSTDKWTLMASILSRLPKTQGIEALERRLKVAEGHIEAGRILALYQVPKPINFLVEAHLDEKGVKQIFRLLLSKFIRRQPVQSDNEWTSLWRDMQSLREKAFTFLDTEYMLLEFCRGLLKAGKFSLARNYLKGTGSVALAPEKAENLVIQAAREYFFSASSLVSSEIWKAKECLNLFLGSSNVKAEADIIDALTVKLPRLGVTLLPVQFRQIKDPMEIIKMAITNQPGAYVHVDELIEVSKLLGLNSQDDISAVEETIAREAAVAGDLHLAFDLCLSLVKKGHGVIWDLCAAIARGPVIENMDVISRKLLLGFALSHCDDESITELLHAWKDLDLQGQCETMTVLTGTSPDNIANRNVLDLSEEDDSNVRLDTIENTLSSVAKELPPEKWESVLKENEKVRSFTAWKLPWLLELSKAPENGKNSSLVDVPGKSCISIKAQSMVTILSWLVKNDLAPRDDLIATLAKSVLESPATEEEDILGCSFLLNLVDAFSGVEVIEEQLRVREDYQEVSSIMNVGMKYGLLHNAGVECKNASHRRDLLLKLFKDKRIPLNADAMEQFGKVQSSFWREWKLKLEGQKRVADHTRVLEQIIPGVDAARFLSGDVNYIQSSVFSLIESLKTEKKRILGDLLKVANTYGLDQAEVLLRFLGTVLVSELWSVEEIADEIANVKGEIVSLGEETIRVIRHKVYPSIDGRNKQRLAFLYGLLSECYSYLEAKDDFPNLACDPAVSTFGLASYYKLLEQVSMEVSFVKNLNFKNIAVLDGLNLGGLSAEVFRNLDEYCLKALASMVDELVGIYKGADPLPDGLISGRHVYKHFIQSLLDSLDVQFKANFDTGRPEIFQGLVSLLEETYNRSLTYIKLLASSDIFELMRRFFTVSLVSNDSCEVIPDNSAWQECLIVLLNFFLKLTEEMLQISSHESFEEVFPFNPRCQMSFMKSLIRLVMEDTVSPSQAWGTVVNYMHAGFESDSAVELRAFCRALIFSGCGFGVISEVISETVLQGSGILADETEDVPKLYLYILEAILLELSNGFRGKENLCQVLASLTRMEGDIENLRRVREAVWKKMADFSNGTQLPGQVRVYVLELMQLITGRHITGTAPEPRVLQWEGWDESHSIGERNTSSRDSGFFYYPDTSDRLTNTLVALRTTQIVGAISPNSEVTPQDLLDISNAFSCFMKLCQEANTESHLDALVAVLGEWEGLFVQNRDKESSSVEVPAEGGDDWGNDDWDEGWESFQEVETVNEKKKKGESPSIHPLHDCWTELLRKYICLSHFGKVILLLDQSLTKCSVTLIDEGSAQSLSKAVSEVDCFIGLKIVLSLPYGDLHLQCLEAVEENLKQAGITERINKDLEFLALVLSSGISATIISKSGFDATFSYMCYLVGHFARHSQESQLSNRHEDEKVATILLFGRVLLPAFICELVRSDQHVLAGLLITKYMHTNPSLGVVNITEACLERFLEGQLYVLEHDDEDTLEKICSNHKLKSTITRLRCKLGELIREALPLIRGMGT